MAHSTIRSGSVVSAEVPTTAVTARSRLRPTGAPPGYLNVAIPEFVQMRPIRAGGHARISATRVSQGHGPRLDAAVSVVLTWSAALRGQPPQDCDGGDDDEVLAGA